MKIIETDNADNCFDGDFVVKYKFDTALCKEDILSLKQLGAFQYYGSFPKPLFRLTCANGIFVTGVQGSNECKVIYGRERTQEEREVFAREFERVLNTRS